MKGTVLTARTGWQIGLLFQKFGSSLSLRRVDNSLFALKMQALSGGAQTIAAEGVRVDPFFREGKSHGPWMKSRGVETNLGLRVVWK